MDAWLKTTSYQKGAIAGPQTLYELGADWYATRLDAGWEPAGVAEATALFARHGLTGPFWALALNRIEVSNEAVWRPAGGRILQTPPVRRHCHPDIDSNESKE